MSILNVIKNIETNYPGYFLVLIFGYIGGHISKDIYINSVKKFVIKKSLGITIFILLSTFFIQNPDYRSNAVTFASIYFGFWLSLQAQLANDQKKTNDILLAEKKKVKAFLTLISGELYYNKYQLESLKGNFQFYLNDMRYLAVTTKKFNDLVKSATFLKSDVYRSFLSSGHVVSLTYEIFESTDINDNLINNLVSAYDDIEYLKSFMNLVGSDLETKYMIFKDIAKSQPGEFDKEALINSQEKIKKTARELAITYRSTAKAYSYLEEILIELKLNRIKEPALDEKLNDEDRKFVEKVIKDIPSNITNPFNKQ